QIRSTNSIDKFDRQIRSTNSIDKFDRQIRSTNSIDKFDRQNSHKKTIIVKVPIVAIALGVRYSLLRWLLIP
ncbi:MULTISPECIES: hypothetical protein, partial [unclassified Microcoleus]|uniref:hypothetical protein n=1 Tax=unclassified Microcoleus TaxID=2642155 RepID=UPI002FD3C1D0